MISYTTPRDTTWRTPTGEYGAEWDQAHEVRTAIEVFRQ